MTSSPNWIDLASSLPSRAMIQAEMIRRATERSLGEGEKGLKSARKRCRSLHAFVKEAWPILEPMAMFIDGKHIEIICAYLEKITRGELGPRPRLLINIPPGCMKSLLVSVLWPAWEWGPAGKTGLRYLCTSYDISNVRRDCRKMRELVESEWYAALWPEVRLTSRAELLFHNDKTGERRGEAFASLTGKRGNRIIIDDPHSTEHAESDADRGTAIRIFRESVTTRLNDPVADAIVIIMQRLHQHDVSGVALALKLGYMHLMLPMEYEPERRCEIDWRQEEGELLWPKRFPREVVEADKSSMGAYGVAGQYQQRPSPRGGLMFKRHWFDIVGAAPANCRWVRGWDLAASKAKIGRGGGIGPAYTAGVLLGRAPGGKFYVGHVTRFREEGNAVREGIVRIARSDGRHVEISIPQDPGASGKIVRQDYIAALAGFNAYASPESGEKEDRARPVAAQAEAGNVALVEGPWNEAFLAELELFPSGAYKDQVDALSRAFSRFVASAGSEAVIVAPMLLSQQRTYVGDPNGG